MPQKINALLRIAEALERLAPPPAQAPDFSEGDSFIWQAELETFTKIHKVHRIQLDLLIGLDQLKNTLLANSTRFAQGFAANNALLWGARGMGKSSLVKAIHGHLLPEFPQLKLIEIQREDLPSLTRAIQMLRHCSERFILFCDDLSFDQDDSHYKTLKTVLDGGLEGRPENVILYATSNRRHLMPRDMIENENSRAINPNEAIEEKVSLSDRFGLWIGFYPCSQTQYLDMIQNYTAAYGIDIEPEALRAEVIEWQATRGARSGRVAWQFFTDLAGRKGIKL